MKREDIPKPILEEMEDLGLNHCEQFTKDGVTYYSLAMMAEDGSFAPMGLPIIYKIVEGALYQLDDEESMEILKEEEE